MKHGETVWVRGTWKEGSHGRPLIDVNDGYGLHIPVEHVDWMPDPAVKESLTAPEDQSPAIWAELRTAPDLTPEAEDREFRDRCALIAMQEWKSESACFETMAWWAYEMAEAMVGERRRRRDGR